MDEILDYLVQIFKGIKFCHDNLIAHLICTLTMVDLDSDNILFNFLGCQMQPVGTTETDVTGLFQSHFPIQYYINDFKTTIGSENMPESQMLNADIDREVKGFLEKHLKALHEDFLFDDVFGKYFAQEGIQSEQIMQAFNEVHSTTTVNGSFLKATLQMAMLLLMMIAQMWSSNLELRLTMLQLVDSVVEMQCSCPAVVLSDYIGIQWRAVEWCMMPDTMYDIQMPDKDKD
ncbi:uncharacterized protein BT62DRAFT_921596 [Guyanagaster necrorhizus]|uniref:Protein kinase domain-containing protein n=1 Tax=Guyanagaster necrorhizus TaxID=856835 RepID=A0A9P8AQG3_9AGAR|nr:uncharacterized protein BT62DRAFT_921596 [Guyanagaster necrorhizus MCA 3950]KAG7443960.1 hypothetical protein BT62DRAFT_921596 [Guyanagaster necrorhizus MCA 3950]